MLVNNPDSVKIIALMKQNILTDKESIEAFKLFGLWRFLKLEVETGMKMSRYGSAYSQVKQLTGFKGNKKKVFDLFTDLLLSAGVIESKHLKGLNK
jgi:hypothetical protein